MNNKILSGQTAIVTGSGRGIGREIALALAGAGSNVVLCARNKNELDATTDLINSKNGNAIAVQCDVSNLKEAEKVVQTAIKKFGSIELLVNNAGVAGKEGNMWEIDPEEWRNVIEVNLVGAFNLSHFVLKEMVKKKKGRIICVSSNAALFSMPVGFSAYSASKAGMLRLTASIAVETEKLGITAFAISPGLVKTEMTREIGIWEDVPEDTWSPLELTGKLCISLASGKADKLSGRYLHVRDDFNKLINRADEIIEKELYEMTLNKL